LGFEAETPLEEGLRTTVANFRASASASPAYQ
jgi:hypothetical protein